MDSEFCKKVLKELKKALLGAPLVASQIHDGGQMVPNMTTDNSSKSFSQTT